MAEPVSIQAIKSFWDSRPCNIRHSNAPFGSKLYFDEVEKRKYFVEPHIPGFAEFEAWNQKTVLEIGCGIGTDAINFVRAGANYTGIELSKESLKITRNRFNVYGFSGRLLEGNAEEVHSLFPHEKFDLIYSFGVLHHTPNIAKAFSSIRNLCHEETEFNFMVYAENSWKNSLIKGGLEQPEAQHGCPIANTYTREEITLLLSQSGFKLLNLSQDHIFPYKVDKYIDYEYIREDWFESMPNSIFQALQKSLGWHLLCRSKLAG